MFDKPRLFHKVMTSQANRNQRVSWELTARLIPSAVLYRFTDMPPKHRTNSLNILDRATTKQRSMCMLSMVVIVSLLACSSVLAQSRVVDSVHNLSAGGQGQVRAETESEVCIFCHSPHNTGGVSPLWNRQTSISTYNIYNSSTLDANPGQPTGASKLCLSCHDGTIALGSVLTRVERLRMIGGDFIPAGLANLGTDLSDDHPISFMYTSGLAASDRQLTDPLALPPQIKLENTGEMQCTSCHDPHNNSLGGFLVTSDSFGGLCITCHQLNGWTVSSHQQSGAFVAGSVTGDWPYPTVSQNACRSCHRTHSASGKERLLIFLAEEDNCLSCHDGSVAQANIKTEIAKPNGHDPRVYLGAHDPIEGVGAVQPHVECADCHNPHAVQAITPSNPGTLIGPTLINTPGVTIGGVINESAQFEYEVCLRCHGDSPVPTTQRVSRLSQSTNLRLKVSATNASYHPIVAPTVNSDTVSLIPSLPIGSMIRCTDCHNNDAGPRAGGAGPDGPHGSIYLSLLERNYTVTDNANESTFEYALCYKCHQRSSILSDQSFSEHRKHIVGENAPCSACHDPHGISNTQMTGSDHTHLINFDTTIVRPEPRSGQLFYRDQGRFAGSCTLTCHGEDHRDESYK